MPDAASPLTLLAGPAFTWNGGNGSAVTLTFSFADTGSSAGWSAFTAAQREATRQALAAWATGGGLTFVEVPDTAQGAGIDLRFHMEMLEPWYANGRATLAPEGDVVLNARLFGTDSLAPGRLGYETLLHEIGHALGLKHSFEGEATLPPGLDTRDTTVMSYTRGSLGVAAAPRALDLAAIEAIYGPAQPDAPTVNWDAAAGQVLISAHGPEATLRGTALSDRLEGGSTLLGREGDDILRPAPQAFLNLSGLADGGPGFDVLDVFLPASALSLALTGAGSGLLGSLRFTDIEEIHFLDARLALSGASEVATVALIARLATGSSPDAVELGALLATPDAARAALAMPGERLSGLEDSALINLLYREALGREAEAEGMAAWTARLQGEDGLPQVLAGIAGSAEAQAHTAIPSTGLWALDPEAVTVHRLYHAILGREAEAEGLAFYLAWLEGGASRAELAAGMLGSSEFSQLRQGRALVETMYDVALGRTPDAEGAAAWQHLLTEGSLDAAGFALAVMDSPEFQARHAAWQDILPG
ncbi:Matrixin [Acetobacteraceae bacterium AT-5844]|nr:Matrixin [Acetobacteraceae bacterium AT-5844]